MREIRNMMKKLASRHRKDWEISGDSVNVLFGDTNRHQRVKVVLKEDMCVMTSEVLGSGTVTAKIKKWDDLARMVWTRNAEHELVTFAFDKQDRLVGQIRHPAQHLDPEELELYITTLARECDRFEYQLGGVDRF